ncbi:DUF2019 domain-containing protein [Corallococcus macrosporus]|uniref:DUF2019 domain-containing protein n=1 Tax=Corallococcus macrosporus TaxID=35 RepID=A0ABS3DMG9_9BACT|nr:DUF2019 domain-containing protein [Corallococcus macrosporus]MBN8232513.1 DUF2019 domain-containing protein [Corallococcus macrosporus]
MEKLVDAFALHSAAQNDAVRQGDANTANKHAMKVNETFDKLCAHGNAGRDALAALINHPRTDVQVKAAAFLLRHRTDEAKAVLQEAARGQDLVSFAASKALKRWADGTWALDPG